VTLEFLAPGATVAAGDGSVPVARSPMERDLRAAGARFEVRDGWQVPVAVGDPGREAEALRATVGWADASPLGKLELQAPAGDLAAIVAEAGGGARLELGRASRAAGAWWCPVTPERALVLCAPGRLDALRDDLERAAAGAAFATVLDVSPVYAGLTIAGPLARELLARFCALDLRPQACPVGGLRPGSVARTPGTVLREDEDRFLVLFGAALGHYLWTVVDDAGRHLGGAPVGVDALAPLPEPAVREEAAPHA
jgi:sarcosine oxidase subunit gamma